MFRDGIITLILFLRIMARKRRQFVALVLLKFIIIKLTILLSGRLWKVAAEITFIMIICLLEMLLPMILLSVPIIRFALI
jgi:hypothetical protein